MPNAPGSSADTMGRIVATRLGEALTREACKRATQPLENSTRASATSSFCVITEKPDALTLETPLPASASTRSKS